jgi:putative hydrolase of the HAD superfamily
MSAWRHLRLITIDLDDTLWPCAPVIRAAEAAHFDWLREQAPRLTAAYDLAGLRQHRLALMQTCPEIAHDVTAVRHRSLQALLDAHAYPLQIADQALEVFRQARNRVEPYPETGQVLSRLRRHCRLVAVTNGNAEVQETGLRDVFDHRLTAAEVGAAKPDPALFEQAMAWADATPAQTLHVGDDPHLDVEAARALGIAAVWVNRDQQAWPEALAPPVLEVPDLEVLERWLALPGEDE